MAQDSYDVIIVGSGAGGGMATYQLANAGLKVALIEAGDFYDPAADEQRTQLRFLGNHRAAQVLEDDHLAILTLALEDGSLTMSPLQQLKAPNLCGGEPGCLAAGLITGAEYL